MSVLRVLASVLALALTTACSGVAPTGTVPPPAPAGIVTPSLPTAAGPIAHGVERIVPSAALERPAQPEIAVSYRADLLQDHCVDRDLAAPPAEDEVLVVLDRTYALPAAYVPGDLIAASAAGLGGVSGTKLVRARLVEDLAAMADAWQAAGLTIEIESAYRSYASQAATFDSWVARVGLAGAMVRSARPGHSEHQLGTALDLTSPGWSGRSGDWALESDEGAWMAEHGWEFGFVMSYPAGVQDATCFSYEPWHYRWIGRANAAAHRESGLDLRRFLERFVAA